MRKTQQSTLDPSNPTIIVALDFAEQHEALRLVDTLDPQLCRLKVGKEMFTRFGPGLVKQLIQRNFAVFLDLKFHDIPNTVAKACAAAADLGVWMLNVHVLGGRRMLEAAQAALARYSHKPLLIGVTLLTSMDQQETTELGLTGTPEEIVQRLALLAYAVGLDGVVCSAQEAAVVRQACGTQFCLVTPGIRLTSTKDDDQTRIMTPAAAVAAGANYLVIGRPIITASNPLQVLQIIQQQLAQAKSL